MNPCRVCTMLVCVLLGIVAVAWFNPTTAAFQDTRQGSIGITTADNWTTSSEESVQPESKESEQPNEQPPPSKPTPTSSPGPEPEPTPTASAAAEPESVQPSTQEPSEQPTSDVSVLDSEGEQQ